ncbi:MAG: polysaccharide biosynthesis tyrosine autokinase, partial [Longimicrobiales bacterium]
RDPVAQASIINRVMDQFVLVANDLKTGQLDERVKILGDQLTRTGAELTESERQLESFRVQTITLPSEQGVVVTPGLQATRDPAFTSFFNLKERVDNLQYDRAKLVEALEAIPTRGVQIEAFDAVTSVAESNQLSAVLAELGEKRQELRDLRLRYTDEHPPVARTIAAIDLIENETVPTIARLLNDEMLREEQSLGNQLQASATELAQIPPRSIEEARLSRNVTIVGTLYTELRQRYEQASLEAASSIPDVRVLDRSVPPEVPNDDQRTILALLLAMGGLGIGVAAGLILERMDPRLRDIRDVTSDLGFTILGAIPNAPSGRSQKAQIGRNSVVEAFRALRLNTSYAFGNSGPILISVTSPAPQEGKTTVSVNLALAFSELGKRTLLVDADTRRGDLHEPFGLLRNPGLVTYLSEEATQEDVIRHVRDNLDVVTSGERSARSPELLSSSRMLDLLADAKGEYEVIIIDSPPIGAGSDAFVLGTICGSSILVLRSGITDLGYAEVMTEPFRRLPVRLLGVVMNDVKPGSGSGPTRHYANYLPDYGATDELVQIG